nr:MAG TPA: hypothetical protein [Caudoviricetes sp.]
MVTYRIINCYYQELEYDFFFSWRTCSRCTHRRGCYNYRPSKV